MADLYDGPCVAGCQKFHGDETRHHKSCGHYPESLTRCFEERIATLERRVAAADKLAEAVNPFAASLERYSGFTEYALFGIWEDVNGAAGRKLNILRKANFDDARAALAAYEATKEQSE